MSRRVIVDTDTAGDDTQAILLLATADSVELEAVTVATGNVEFDYHVENAKYTLDVADAADEVPVYEGARRPLVKDHEHVSHIHGEGGLGGDFFPDTGIASEEGFAPDAIVEAARESPGEISLCCIAPLTNVALALRREPNLNELLDEVWVMGGAVNTLGNDTPSAEYNFWVDPEAAKMVMRELDVTLVDWGLTVRDATFEAEFLDRLESIDSEYAEFYQTANKQVRQFSQKRYGEDTTTQPDSLTAACLVAGDGLITESSEYFVDVDEREGMTRGYSLVDELGITDGDPRTRVVESVDEETFREMFEGMLAEGAPERPL